MREVVYKQCSQMRRGRNTYLFVHVLGVVGLFFSLGFLASHFGWRLTTLDNSQSIMSDDFIHSSQYSGPIAVSVLAVLLDKSFVLHSQ